VLENWVMELDARVKVPAIVDAIWKMVVEAEAKEITAPARALK
jgi:hypothetical protein